ncbi:MAG: glycosyltransferase [Enterocloster sp.]
MIIPVYRPGETVRELKAPGRPDPACKPYITMNTEQAYWDRWLSGTGYSLPENLSVFHVTRETFDHGATRDAGIRQSDAGICVCMTDDALPADQYLLENLVRGLTEKEGTAVAYGRQLPDRDCGIIERYTRAFNYPEESRLKTREDLPELGIKTYFCSNVCAAYKRSVWSWAALRKRPSSTRT